MPIQLPPPDPRLGVSRHRLPPPAEVSSSEIRLAIAAFHAATNAAREASGSLADLRRERPKAVEQDAQALADALERGDQDPGPRAVRSFDERVADAERLVAGTRIVAERALESLRTALAEHGDDWVHDLEQRRQEALARWDETLAALDAQRTELDAIGALISFTERGVYREPRDGPDLLAQLRSYGRPLVKQKPGLLVTGPALRSVA